MSEERAGSRDPIRVTHFGNAVHGQGGIASVIRSHLARASEEELHVSSVPTFYQDAGFALSKWRPFLSAVRRLRRLPRDEVVHVHISQRASLIREGYIVKKAKSLGHPVVVTLHGSSLSSPTRFADRRVRELAKSADVVHGFSDLYRERFGIEDDAWALIPNDVAVPGSVTSVYERPKLALFVGEVGYRKGVDRLLRAWQDAHTQEWRLRIIGPISDPDLLVDMDKSIEAIGPLDHESVLTALLDARLLVLPSRAEAFPMSVCEGLASGCAIIGTRVGGMGELLDQSSQLAVHAPEELAGAIELLIHDESKLREQAELAYRYAAETLSTDSVTARWIQIYRALLGTEIVR